MKSQKKVIPIILVNRTMIKKIRKPSQDRPKTTANAKRVVRPNPTVNKLPVKKEDTIKGPDEIHIDDIIL